MQDKQEINDIEIKRYNVQNKKLSHKKIIFISDLHSDTYPELERIVAEEPDIDYMFVVGDIFDGSEEDGKDDWGATLNQLRNIADSVPIYCSLGNHEVESSTVDYLKKKLKANRIYMLDDNYVELGDMIVYGFTPPAKKEVKPYPLKNFTDPLERERTIVLCHRPSDYIKYLQGYCPFLTLSGHAHGGQWRLFNRGFYAPDEGLFPKYTSGFYIKNRLLVSRGLGNKCGYPRINNKPEIIILTIN